MVRRLQVGVWLVMACVVTTPDASWANPRDISLRALGRPASRDANDPAQLRFRGLASELAFALSPRPLAPAETLGMSGFEFSIASTTADISQGADYWMGQPGQPVFEGVLSNHGSKGVPRVFWVPTLHLRKGLPFSSEVGISGSYLAWSEMFMFGAEAKIALYESYYRYVPDLSVRGAAGRLFGSSDIDMMTFEGDVLTSLAFGIGGMVQLTPYAGFGLYWAHVNSQVLDETPYAVMGAGGVTDQKGGDDGSLYTFETLDWRDNRHTRVLFGLRLNVAMIELIGEADMGMLDLGGLGKKTLWSGTVKLGFDI